MIRLDRNIRLSQPLMQGIPQYVMNTHNYYVRNFFSIERQPVTSRNGKDNGRSRGLHVLISKLYFSPDKTAFCRWKSNLPS